MPLTALEPILKSLFEAKALKVCSIDCAQPVHILIVLHYQDLSFSQIASEIGRDEIWVASVFYGQVQYGFHNRLYHIHTTFNVGEAGTSRCRVSLKSSRHRLCAIQCRTW